MLSIIPMLPQLGIGAADLAAAFLFLYGLHRMSSPVTAPSGIFVAGIGMAVAVLASFLYAFGVSQAAQPHLMINIALVIVALAIGGGAAWWGGRTVAMTAMPQMVAIYNGMGGGAAGAIAAVELFGGKADGMTALIVTLVGALIGAVSFVDCVGQVGWRDQKAAAIQGAASLQRHRTTCDACRRGISGCCDAG